MREEQALTNTTNNILRYGRHFIPFGIGLVVGGFGAVLVGATSSTGVGLSIYLSSATAAVVTGIGLFSAWALAARADSIKSKRRANLARLRVRGLRKEWQLLHELLGDVGHNPWKDEQITRAWKLLPIIYKAAETTPDFDDILDTEEDLRQAQSVLDIFDFTRRQLSPPHGPPITTRSYIEKKFRRQLDAMTVGFQIDGLRAAEAHFDAKG